jgi:hypothetical protein
VSGQAKRSRVLAAQHHREQVARAIAEACGEYGGNPTTAYPRGWRSSWRIESADGVERSGDRTTAEEAARRAVQETVVEGGRFDVAKAREYGERLIAEARHAGAHAVVDDWRRAQGREPAMRPARCRRCHGSTNEPVTHKDEPWSKCRACRGQPNRLTRCDPPGLPPDVPGSALSWQASVRLGRRLLAALEGQPSECQGCRGPGSVPLGTTVADVRGGVVTVHAGLRVEFVTIQGLSVVGHDGQRREASLGAADVSPCDDCHGTGHNLHGVLPPVEDSPQVIRAAVEAVLYAPGRAAAAPLDRVYDRNRRAIEQRTEQEWRALTRVVPRGEHRYSTGDRLEVRMLARGWAGPYSRLPRWRRGEIKHAEQRRARAQATQQA